MNGTEFGWFIGLNGMNAAVSFGLAAKIRSESAPSRLLASLLTCWVLSLIIAFGSTVLELMRCVNAGIATIPDVGLVLIFLTYYFVFAASPLLILGSAGTVIGAVAGILVFPRKIGR